MSFSYTNTESKSFTITHAKKIAVKVATDLKRMQRFYNEPSDERIEAYEEEVIQMLNHGYLKKVSYGFQKGGQWIEPSLHYEARDFGGLLDANDDPGKIRPRADITGASFYSYMIYSERWQRLTEEERRAFKKQLPFQRGGASEPGINGYLEQDKVYSAGGRSVVRSTIRSY